MRGIGRGLLILLFMEIMVYNQYFWLKKGGFANVVVAGEVKKCILLHL